jgi:hypothetical protein
MSKEKVAEPRPVLPSSRKSFFSHKKAQKSQNRSWGISFAFAGAFSADVDEG